MSITTKLTKFQYQYVLKPILFQLNPNIAHELFLKIGEQLGKSKVGKALVRKILGTKLKDDFIEIDGIKFRNRIGLSAGFDKDAQLPSILEHVGFGFAQVGSVTADPYEGNPGEWLKRLKKSKALVVNFGLKSKGVDHVLNKLEGHKYTIPISLSVAKTNSKKTATTESGVQDYLETIIKTYKKDAKVDIFTLNISCPNTFGGEPFTTPEKLKKLLDAIQQFENKNSKAMKVYWIKMPLYEDFKDLEMLLEIARDYSFIKGIVMSNLEKDYKNPAIKEKLPENKYIGGISGKPTAKKTINLLKSTKAKYKSRFTLISVGGIFTPEDAKQRLEAGADLLQLITGMVYEGPQVINELQK